MDVVPAQAGVILKNLLANQGMQSSPRTGGGDPLSREVKKGKKE